MYVGCLISARRCLCYFFCYGGGTWLQGFLSGLLFWRRHVDLMPSPDKSTHPSDVRTSLCGLQAITEQPHHSRDGSNSSNSSNSITERAAMVTTTASNSIAAPAAMTTTTANSIATAAATATTTKAAIPTDTWHRPNVGPMLGQRCRRWTNISTTLGRCLVFVEVATATVNSNWAGALW